MVRGTYTTKLTGLPSKRSQSALEYMMTYGWAILIIVIVAAVLYSMGIFNPSSSSNTTATGFAQFTPLDFSCTPQTGFSAVFGNDLGSVIKIYNASLVSSSEMSALNLSIKGGPAYILQGGTFDVINSTASPCPSSGSRYALDFKFVFTYEGVNYTSIGALSGTVGIAFSSSQSNSSNSSSFNPLYWYAANNSKGVFIYNSAFSLVKSLEVPGTPRGIAITPNDKYFFVAQYNYGLSLLNATSGATISNMSASEGAWAVEVTKNNKLAYTTEYQGNYIGLYNFTSATFNPIFISIGASTMGMIFNNNDSLAYISGWGLADLYVINLTSNTIKATYALPNSENRAVALSNNQKFLYISEIGVNQVIAFNLSSDSVTTTLSISGPQGIVVPKGLNLAYISSSSYIDIVNTTTNVVSGSISVSCSDSAITASPNGKLVFAACYSAGEVEIINTTTNSVSNTIPLPSAIGISYLTHGDGGY